jgi:hypothetical protein
MRLGGFALSLFDLWGQDLQRGSITVIIIIRNIRRGDYLRHQVFILAIARHHEQISIPLPHLGFESAEMLPLLHLLHLDYEVPGVAYSFIPTCLGQSVLAR